MNENAINKAKKITAAAIILGTVLYLSKFLREYVAGDHTLLFILGFLPNLGMAFAIPFIYVTNRLRFGKPLKHFTIACGFTLLLMILNEIRDRYQAGRVFDWFDIYASIAGVVLAYLLFQLVIKPDVVASKPGRGMN